MGSILYRITCRRSQYFAKVSNVDSAFIVDAEYRGLKLLGSTGSVHIPASLKLTTQGSIKILTMEFIQKVNPSHEGWQNLGESLANLHRYGSDHFGDVEDNYLGELPQSNTSNRDWAAFYRDQRIHAQVMMAKRNGYLGMDEVALAEMMYRRFDGLFKHITPSLIHGDLWNGNVVFREASEPVLIDPSAYFGDRELDLAMSRLFGGFPNTFYKTYEANFPLYPGWEERLPLYQLYYLLVHLNLFGRAYYSPVMRIISRYV